MAFKWWVTPPARGVWVRLPRSPLFSLITSKFCMITFKFLNCFVCMMDLIVMLFSQAAREGGLVCVNLCNGFDGMI